MEQLNPDQYSSPHDWESIRLSYVTCEKLPKLTVFASNHGVTYQLLRNYISEYNWRQERQEYLQQLRAERRAKAIEDAVDSYQSVSSETVELARLLQDIIRVKLEQARAVLELGDYQGGDEDEDQPQRPREIRSSDVLNYTSALRNITEILKSNSDIAFGLNAMVTAGILSKQQVAGIQTALAAGETQMRLVLSEAFPEPDPDPQPEE